MKRVKEKLTERVDEINEENKAEDAKAENNVIPFSSPDNLQVVSLVPEFAITLQEARQRILMLQSFVKEMMIPGTDYGLIPKCDKPSLFKSGAEKLCDIFGFSKQLIILNRVEDWKEGVFHYEVKVILVSKRTGHIEAEGIGSCNNKENKYKNLNAFNIVNTILKMSKKRAFIDAVLSATRSSGIFTQDIVDEEGYAPDLKEIEASQKASNASAASNSSTPKNNPISKNQLTEIFTLVAQKKIPVNEVKAYMLQHYKVGESKALNEHQAKSFIEYLKAYKAG